MNSTLSTMLKYLILKSERSADDIEWLNRPFLKKRKIILTGYITQEYSELLSGYIVNFRAQNNKPIYLFISSGGGYVQAASYLCEVIRTVNRRIARVHAVVMEGAGSAALDIVQACDKRIAWPKAYFLLHGSDLAGKRIHDADLNQFIRETKKEDLESLKVLSDRSGQSMEALLAWSRQSKVFTATEALKYGLIDEIKRIYP